MRYIVRVPQSRSALVRSLVAAALLGAPSIARGQTPAQAKPLAILSTSASSMRDSLVAMARAQIGRPYVLGAESPGQGFDCSGLVQYIAAALHVKLPRTAAEQAGAGSPVSADTARLLPGDLLTFGRGTRISHVGIYVGNGRMVHASPKAGRVIETALVRSRVTLAKPWRGARRLVMGDTTDAPR